MDTAEDAPTMRWITAPSTRPSSTACSRWGVRHDPRVLDMGCGTAQIRRAGAAAARRPHRCHRPRAAHARRRRGEPARSGVAERVELRLADCKALDFPDGAFDLAIRTAWCTTCPSRRPRCARRRVVRPAGRSFFAICCAPSRIDEVAPSSRRMPRARTRCKGFLPREPVRRAHARRAARCRRRRRPCRRAHLPIVGSALHARSGAGLNVDRQASCAATT